jgi:NAD dependent epimerase/dehydratase family enzyme
LLGTSLSQKLRLMLGYEVIHLSRYKSKVSKYQIFTWDIANGLIEEVLLTGVDYIIHLAGAGVADKRWTDESKKGFGVQ